MPYPQQVSGKRIIAAARQLIEAEGADQLSLAVLAAALNVKAPSLYRYFSSKTELIRAVNTSTLSELVEALMQAVQQAEAQPHAQLIALAKTYRAYAHAHPATYMLAFSSADPALQPDASYAEGLALPLQRLIGQISGEAQSLPALRGALAIIHGFTALEISGQFRRGGDLDQAFEAVIDAYLRGWAN